MYLCQKLKEICLLFLCQKQKKKYVFMFLCLKIKSSLPRVGRVARSAGRVFFSTPSVLSSFGLVPLRYGDSLKLMSKTKKELCLCVLMSKLKINMSLCSYVRNNKKAPLHYVAALNIFEGISVNSLLRRILEYHHLELEYNGYFVHETSHIQRETQLQDRY